MTHRWCIVAISGLLSIVGLPHASAQSPVNVKSFGAVCDGQHMSADTSAFRAILSVPRTGPIYIPAGNCQIDNSQVPLQMNGYTGTIYGDGYSSNISFGTLKNDGVVITNPMNLTISSLQLSFAGQTTTRGGGYLINVQGGTAVTMKHLFMHNGNLSAMRIGSSRQVTLTDIHVEGFLANGIYTLNNSNLTAQVISCSGNGDACFEASYYDSQSPNPCDQVTIDGLTSDNDVSGILINSCTDVVAKHFVINNAAHEGLWIGQDPATTTTHFPDNIIVSDGRISNSGFGTNSLSTGTAAGIVISITSHTSTSSNVQLSRIGIVNTMGYGLVLADDDTVSLTSDNLAFDSNGAGSILPAIYLDGNNVRLTNTCMSHVLTQPLLVKYTSSLVVSSFEMVDSTLGVPIAIPVVNRGGGAISVNGVMLPIGQSSVPSIGSVLPAATCPPPAWD